MEFARQLLQRIQAVAELNPPTSCSPISTGLMLEWELRGAKLYFEIDEESVLCAIRLNGLLQFRYEDVSFDVQRAFVTAKKFHQADV